MAAGKEKSIKTLVAGCRRGNKDDWVELVNRMAPVIFSICYRFRLSREESFDVFGKVSLMVLKNLAVLRDESKILGYVSTIARREAAAVRSQSRAMVEMLGEGRLDRLDPKQNQPAASAMERNEELEMMAMALAGLSRKCRTLLTMLFLEPEIDSYREIARRIGIPVSSIGPTRQRCLKKLRAKMIEQGYEE